MAQRQVHKIERMRTRGDDGYRTLSFFVRPGRVRGKWIWFEPSEVPEHEGEVAWFECERVKGGWKVLHQVPERGG